MVNENGVNHAATSAALLGLVMRSFGLATGVGLGILLVTALFSL
jgi:hypothetical protein